MYTLKIILAIIQQPLSVFTKYMMKGNKLQWYPWQFARIWTTSSTHSSEVKEKPVLY